MRTYTLNASLMALLALPLAACPADNTIYEPAFPVRQPRCDESATQVLTTDALSQLICKDLPLGLLSLPSCAPDTEALTSDAGGNIRCTPRNSVDATTESFLTVLTTVERQVQNLRVKVFQLGTGPGVQATYLGLSRRSVTGRITSGTSTPGVAAAAALCTSDYGAGAHMCTPYEIYYSAALSKNLSSATSVSGGWVYMQSWKTPGGTATPEPTAGLADNCGGYTSETPGGAGSNQWTGTTFKWVPSSYVNTLPVPKFFADTSCSVSQSIACCR